MAITNATRVANFGSGIGTEGAVLQVDNTNDRLGVGTTNPQAMLQVGTGVSVYGNSGIVSATSFYGDGANLTNVGMDTGVVVADQILVLGVTTVGSAVTINSTGIDAVSGVITAANFVGGGANLTSLPAANLTGTLPAISGANLTNLSGTAIASGTVAAARVATLNQNTSGTAANLSGTPDITINNITGVAATFTGVLTYEDVTNVDSVGIITARSGIKIGAAGIGGTIASNGNVTLAGIVTATKFKGDGSELTGVVSGIELLQAGSSVGTSLTAVNFASGATLGIVTTLLLSDAQDHKVTATGICTVTVSGGTEGESHSVRIINSGIATVGFSTYFLFPSGSAPALPTADAAISLVSFTINRVGLGGTQLLAGASLNFS
jgi:hypothetical protein